MLKSNFQAFKASRHIGAQLSKHLALFLSLGFLSIVCLFFAGIYPMTRFIQEWIDIYVSQDSVLVKGYYIYKNPWPIPLTQGFIIPLPADNARAIPIQLSAVEVSPRKKLIPVRYILGKHRFDLNFAANEEIHIKIQYYQYTPERNARYLLTTTRPWRTPLIEGVYRLYPERVRITASNYPVFPDNAGALVFQYQNFMPDKDWRFSWEVQ